MYQRITKSVRDRDSAQLPWQHAVEKHVRFLPLVHQVPRALLHDLLQVVSVLLQHQQHVVHDPRPPVHRQALRSNNWGENGQHNTPAAAVVVVEVVAVVKVVMAAVALLSASVTVVAAAVLEVIVAAATTYCL